MLLKKSSIGALSIAALLFAGCGGGNYIADNESNATAYKEFISYELIRKNVTPEQASETVSLRSVGVSPDDIVNTSLDIACLAQPELLPVKKFSKFVESALKGSKLKKETAQLIESVKELQQAVVQLQGEITYLSGQFYQFVESETYTDLMTQVSDYNATYQNFAGNSNNYLLYIADCIKTDGNNSIDVNATVNNISCMNDGGKPTASSFIAALDDVSGTSLPQDAPDSDIYKSVQENSSAQLVAQYEALQRYFLVNFVPLLPSSADISYDANASLALQVEAYNDNVTGIFQSAVLAIQSAYTASSLINQINYAQGVLQPDATPISTYENNQNLYYSYQSDMNASQNYDAFVKAQTELSLEYTARLNVMTQLTLGYIYSDKPLKDFTYPSMQTDDDSLNDAYADGNYSTYYADALPSSKLDASTLGASGAEDRKFPVINVNDNNSSYIYYMYQGLNQFAACQDTILQGNEVNSSTCPSLYNGYAPSETAGYYSGTYLSVWMYSDSAKKAVLSASSDGHGTNLHKRCDSSAYTQSGQYYWLLGGVTNDEGNLTGFNCQTNTDVNEFSIGSGSYDMAYLGLLWYSTSDSHAEMYVSGGSGVSITYGTLYNYEQCQEHSIKDSYYGTTSHNNVNSYFIDTAKFVCPDEYGDVGNTNSMVSFSVNGYSTNINVDVNLYEQKGFHYHYDVTLSCSGNDPLCYEVDNGLCVGGNKIDATFDGDNTYTLNYDGGC